MARKARQHPLESAAQGAVTPEVIEAIPTASVETREVSLAETKPVTEVAWAHRKLRAEVEQRELLDRYRRNGFVLDFAAIERNSHLMLIYGLIAEGRITQDEVQARLGEYQLLYLRAEFGNAMQRASQGMRPVISSRMPREGELPPEGNIRRLTRTGDPNAIWRPNLHGKVKLHTPDDGDEPEGA